MPLRPTLKLIAGVLAALLLGTSIVLAAGASKAAAPKTMQLGCASKKSGKLRYVKKASDCGSHGRLVRFPADAPVIACQLEQGNTLALRRAKLAPPAHRHNVAGMLFVVSDGAKCKAPKYPDSKATTLPRAAKDLKLCGGKRRGSVRVVGRFSKCNDLEFPVVLKKHKPPVPNVAPDANDDEGLTDKEHPTSISVLANDTDANGDALHVASVDTAGTKGAVTLKQNGTIAYDPNGQFDSLTPSQAVHDKFRYRANDGEDDSDAATVDVTVTGVNHAPVLAGVESGALAYDTGTAATPVTSGLTISDAEGGNLNGATVAIGAGHLDPNDALSFADELGITGSYDSSTGVLTLTGSAPISDYETALRDVKYSATDPTPSGGRAISFQADDGNPSNHASNVVSRDVTVTNVPDPPTDITLANTSVGENRPAATAVGQLATIDPDPGDSFAYSLVPGTGDDDNAQFQVSGKSLQTAASFDNEAKSSFKIRVRTTDSQSNTFEKQFTITVDDANDAPTDIGLSNANVDENQASGASVGTLTSTDQDSGDSHTYTLVTGTGSTDNGSFTIAGSTLKSAAAFDKETKASYSVRVRTNDGHGGTFDKQFTVTVNDRNDAPTNLALSNASVAENQASGATVGTLSSTDQDLPANSFTYTLATGTGDDDNGQFDISGSTLKTNAVFDKESKSSYSIRVKTDDGNGGTFEKQLTIAVTDANDAPTNILLSSSSVAENLASGSTVGGFSSTDQDVPANSFTYSLATGTGDDDNGSFTISGNTLKTNAVFDKETKASYSIRVKTDDGNGGTFEKQFTVTVDDANDAPTNVGLSSASVDENQASGASIGTLSSTDQDSGDSHTYALVSGTGSTDNGSFTIAGSTLKTAATFDKETKSSYSIRIRTSDGHGGTFEKQLTVAINDKNDAPSDIALSSSSVAENLASGSTVGTLSPTDQDSPANTFTYSLATGTGDDDNGSFDISGSTLKTNAVFDRETKSSYSIRVKVDDNAGGTFEKHFTITVGNVNEAPTDISLSNASVAENQASGAEVGAFSTTDPDSGDSFAYSLATGTGDDDNASFTISGDKLKTNASFDVETKSGYSIRVETQDQGGTGLTYQEQFTITVTDVNDAPTLTAIEGTALLYDTGDPGSPITSTLTTADVDNANLKSATVKIDTGYLDGSDTLSFANTANITGSFDAPSGTMSLTTGAGGAPKSEWDTALQSVKFFSAGPTPSGSRTIRFQVDDGQATDHASNIASRDVTVTNDNVAPTDILLSNDTTSSGQPSGQTVGTLSSADADAGDPHSYSLVSGTGSTDNGSFQITGSTLKTNATLTAADYSIRVKTDDGRGGTFEKALTIHVIDNLLPTDITLSNSSIDENGATGDDVGTLSTTDADGGPTFTYTLVSGTGSTDNSLFQINGDKLEAAGTLDFEAAGTRSVRIKTDDGKGGSFEKQLTITVNNKNDAPTNISLSNASVAENQGDAANIGTLSSTDQDGADTHTYTLATGTGDTDNGSFTISGANTLQATQNFDFETKSSYSVRLKTDDGAGGTFEKQFTVTVTNANDVPSDIALQNNTVAENQLAPATVGSLITSDQDTADTTFTYTFATGTGDDDNLKFQLSGTTLQTNAVFDYETKATYKVRLKTDDGHGGTLEKAFMVAVTDVNDAPTDIGLSPASVDENQASNTTVGTLSTTDQDLPANSFTYTLATGTGDGDNGSFTISGNQLKTNASFDYEVDSSYSVRVQTDDGHGGTFEKQLTVAINDINDPPTDIALSKQDIDENKPSATSVGTFSSTDQDVPANTFTYTLVGGTGSADNGSFTISGGTLKTAVPFNFEVKSSYSIRVQTDDGHGGTFQKQFTITINDVNDAPTTVQDDYSGAIGNTKAQVGTSSSGPVVTLSGNIPIANDSDEDATFPHTVSAVAETVPSTGGGSATINADGSFTYLPGVGDKNLLNDSFTYHATDGSLTSAGTATVDIANELVWYVKPGAGGDGRSNAPFSTLSSLNAAGGSGDSDGSADYIFLYGTSNFTGGLPLETNQKLIGEANGLTVNNGVGNQNLVAATGGTATNNPTIQNAAGDAIQLANGSDVERVNAGTSSGVGIKGTSVTTSTVGSTTTISGAAGGAFALSGAAGGNISVGSTITNTAGKSVSIQNRSSGTVSLTGNIGDTGTGIALTSNAGATIDLTGQLTISAGTNTAFSATGAGPAATTGGTVSASNANNTLTTTTGTALNVAHTTIGASGLKFKSIGANGGTNGIVINNTGASGALTVTGTGTTAGSGGTIQNTAKNGAELKSTNNVSLSNMNFTNDAQTQNVAGSSGSCGGNLRTGDNLSCIAGVYMSNVSGATLTKVSVTGSNQIGVNGNNVTGLSLTNSTITDNGDEGFEGGLMFQNLFGTSSITHTAIKNNAARQVHIGNIASSASPLDLSITGTRTQNGYPVKDTSTTEIGNTSCCGANTQQGILLESSGAPDVDMALNINGVVFNNNLPQNAVDIQPLASTGTLSGTTQNSSFDTNSGGVIISMQNGSSGTYNVLNNEFNKTNLQSVLYAAANPHSGNLQGTIQGNTIGTTGQAASACALANGNAGPSACNGIQVNHIGGTGTIGVRIGGAGSLKNTIQEFDNTGISVTGAGASKVNANIVDNKLGPGIAIQASPFVTSASGISLNVGTTAGSTAIGCFGVTGNDLTGPWGDPGAGRQLAIVTNVRFDAKFRLPGYGGAATDTAAVETFLTNNNPTASGRVFAQRTAPGAYENSPGGATCSTP